MAKDVAIPGRTVAIGGDLRGEQSAFDQPLVPLASRSGRNPATLPASSAQKCAIRASC